jgi:hypothetical protein
VADIHDRLERLSRREEAARRAQYGQLQPVAAGSMDDDFAEVLTAVARVVQRHPGLSIMVAAADGRPGRSVIRVTEREGGVETAVVPPPGRPAGEQPGPAYDPSGPMRTTVDAVVDEQPVVVTRQQPDWRSAPYAAEAAAPYAAEATRPAPPAAAVADWERMAESTVRPAPAQARWPAAEDVPWYEESDWRAALGWKDPATPFADESQWRSETWTGEAGLGGEPDWREQPARRQDASSWQPEPGWRPPARPNDDWPGPAVPTHGGPQPPRTVPIAAVPTPVVPATVPAVPAAPATPFRPAPGQHDVQPGIGQPGFGQPAAAQPGYGQPVGHAGSGQQGSGQPGSGQPGSGQAGSGQAGSGQAGSGQPGSGQQGFGQAGSGQPGSGQPGFGPPTGGQAGFGQPAGGQPAQPGFSQPPGQPVAGQPGYAQPFPGQRGNGQAGNGQPASGQHPLQAVPVRPEPPAEAGDGSDVVTTNQHTSEVVARLAQLLREDPSRATSWVRDH